MKFYPAALFTIAAVCLSIVLLISCEKNMLADGNTGGSNANMQVIKDIVYGSAKDREGNTMTLRLDIYIPWPTTAAQKFPFVLFVHGGGFTAGDKSGAAAIMEKFVKAGYVGASIDYRLESSIDGSEDPCTLDSSMVQKAIYRAVQDTKAAIRVIVANADKYHIDTSGMFFAGNSAGAITILHAAFLTQNDFNKIMPGIEAELGGIDNSGNNLTNSFNIVGMAANSGCLPGIQYINSLNKIPVIFFHGGKDSVIPVMQGPANYCPEAMYVFGSSKLYSRLQELDEPAVIHIDPEGGHGPYTEEFLNDNEICFFNNVLRKKTSSGIYSGQQSSCP